MKVLIGCEESQTICAAFRKVGIPAISCDLQPTRGNPKWHIQDDIVKVLDDEYKWDLVILHPDCTALALSGNRHYGNNKPRHNERLEAIEWTTQLWEQCKSRSKRAALENPASVIFQYLGNKVQYIQPWMFGHGETKKTGLALHNLPNLTPTNIVEGREPKVWLMGGKNRKRDRSVTYQGIADAIVDQWGKLLENDKK